MRAFDPAAKISKHFLYKEALWLPHWNRLANESDGLNDTVLAAAEDFFRNRMDAIRDFLSQQMGRDIAIRTHCAYRPWKYNQEDKGAPASCHMYRREPELKDILLAADDWDADLGLGSPGANCDKIRVILMPKLADLGVRMEDRGPGAPWIHSDNHPVLAGHNRYFKP